MRAIELVQTSAAVSSYIFRTACCVVPGTGIILYFIVSKYIPGTRYLVQLYVREILIMPCCLFFR